jgi:phosphatidylserine/phosphatidylglycerophosphate/cardiolipin synthase-like enzyme
MRRVWIFFLMTSPLWAAEPPQAYFSGTDHIDQQIIRLLDRSRQTLDMALFEFSSKPLADALSRAANRGVHVKMVLDPHLAEEKKVLERLEKTPGLSLRFSGSRRGTQGHMHHKFLIIDGETLVTGSYNWTPGAEYVNYENILVEDSPMILRRYEEEFARLWDVGKADGRVSTTKKSGARPSRRSRKGSRTTSGRRPRGTRRSVPIHGLPYNS